MTIPAPPSAAALAGFPSVLVGPGQLLFRIHLERRYPTYYGAEPTGRFNPPPGVTNFGTCYAADDVGSAFVEVLGRSMLISLTDVQNRVCSSMGLSEPTRFADLTDRSILGRFGLTGEVSAGGVESYPRCQEWAAALHAAGFAGVRYRARHDPGLSSTSYAVFGEPGEQDKPLTVIETRDLISDDRIHDACLTFGYVIIPPLTL